MIGEKLSDILEDIETLIWTLERDDYGPIGFRNTALRSSLKIFTTTVLTDMHSLQEKEDMNIEDRMNMARSLADELQRIIKTYTGRNFPL